MQNIGVAIIVKDEKTIWDCLKSFVDHVDQVVVIGQKETPQEIVDGIKAISDKIEYDGSFVWIDDFAAKRNYSFSKLKTDWGFWCDADDIIQNPEKLRALANNATPEVGCIWFPYVYGTDEFGNTSTLYERERLLRMKYGWIWRSRIHETVSPLQECKYVRTNDVVIVHNHKGGANRNERNFRILNLMMKEDPTDKRLWLYMGHQHFANTDWMKAAEWYLKFGMDGGAIAIERWQALCYCSKALREMRDRQSVDVALIAIDLFPQYRDGYLELAHSYNVMGETEKAIHFALLADTKELIVEPPTVIFVNPMEYTFNRYALLAECYEKQGKWEEALKWLYRCYEVRPASNVQAEIQKCEGVIRQNKVDLSIKTLAVELQKNREFAKLPSLLRSIPFWYRDTEGYNQLEGGAMQYIAQLRDEPIITEESKDSVAVNLGKSLDPIKLLDDLDKKYEKISVICPIPNEGSNQTTAMAQKDMEELVASGDNRHILNLQIQEDKIFAEYDHKIPKGLNIRMYVGQGLEHWNPDKIKKIGEGGSETSAAWVCKALSAKGNRTILYAMDNQVWDSVIYRHYSKFNPVNPPCDLFISSRVPDVFNAQITAKQKWLWLHDTHCGARLTPEIASQIDALIVLSQWHAGHIKRVYPFLEKCEVIDFDKNEKTYEDDWTGGKWYEGLECYKLPKIAVIGDGIDTSRFKDLDLTKKTPNRFIWLSSPDRGLEFVLQGWGEIKKSLPDATLKIFYGWNYFDTTLFIKEQRELKARLRELLKQDGVEWCNRIGQDQLAIELGASEFLVYPPPHEFRETYGIAFLEAQAAGVVCFYRKNGSLGETIGNRGIALERDMQVKDWLPKVIQNTKDKGLCNAIRNVGREYAMTRDWEVQASKMLKLYDMLK